MIHKLKTDAAVFNAVREGVKTFEIRKNDRQFRVGDVLRLMCTKYTGEEMENGAPLEYTGDFLEVSVSYVLHGPAYGLGEDWVAVSISKIHGQDKNELIDIACNMAQELEDIISEAENAGCDNPFPNIRALLNDWELVYKNTEIIEG